MSSPGVAAASLRYHSFRTALTAGLVLAGLIVLADGVSLATASRELRFTLGTLALLAVGALMCLTWPYADRRARMSGGVWHTVAQGLVAAGGVSLIAFAAGRALPVIFAGRPDISQADMLPVIDQAVARFLAGSNPYVLFRVPWDVTFAYGPWLWLPFALPHLFAFDPRLLTLVAQSVVPAACIWAASVSVRRARPLDAVMLCVLAGGLLLHPRIATFHAIGHTQVYWPLLFVFCWLVRAERWTAAMFVAGSLVAARTTMLSLLPVLLMYLFVHRRLTVRRAFVMALGAGLPFLPFLLADPGALVNGLFGSYMKLMKGHVWSSTSWAHDTFGATGWLLRHGLQAYVEAVQIVALSVVYTLAWRAFVRGARPEPWLVLALLVFSMTTLWPVLYIYFDVVVLASAALASSVLVVRTERPRLAATFATLVSVAIVTVLWAAAARPGAAYAIDVGTPESTGWTGGGFGRDVTVVEGERTFVWVEGTAARMRLPRASRSSAPIHVGARAAPGATRQRVTATLNGQVIGAATLGADWAEVTFDAPGRAWYYGFNVLELTFANAAGPAAIEAGGEPRRMSAAIDVVRIGR